MATTVGTAIQEQVDNINAVRSGFASVVAGRGESLGVAPTGPGPYPLYQYAYTTDNPAYLNVMMSSTLQNVDIAINAAAVGSGIFSSWFSLHNSYFNANPIPDPATPATKYSTLANVIANIYRWRVGQYFQQCMLEVLGAAGDVPNQYVFPQTVLSLGSYGVTGATNGTFTPTAIGASGPTGASVNQVAAAGPIVSGPGVVGVYVTSGASGATTGATADAFSAVSFIYEAPGNTIGLSNTVSQTSPFVTALTIPAGTTVSSTTPFKAIGATAFSGYSLLAGTMTVGASSVFPIGQKVLVADSGITGGTPYTEVADVIGTPNGTTITVGKCGGPTAGLSANWTSSTGVVYPLFIGVTMANNVNTTGASGDTIRFSFIPDRPLPSTNT